MNSVEAAWSTALGHGTWYALVAAPPDWTERRFDGAMQVVARTAAETYAGALLATGAKVVRVEVCLACARCAGVPRVKGRPACVACSGSGVAWTETLYAFSVSLRGHPCLDAHRGMDRP